MIDIIKIKKDFPILQRKVSGKDLIYLDNAATSQKPSAVLEAISTYYKKHNSNVHRGIHTLSEEATELYEEARSKVAKFIGAQKPEEIVFTKGTTESLNRINYEWGVENLKEGDVILTTESEHHSNLIPWQILSEITGAQLKFVDLDDNGELSMDDFKSKLSDQVKLVAISHASNVLGTVFPIKEVCKLAKQAGALVVVDGAQAIPHIPVNVTSLGCDFYAFSSHKMLGPMGIGVLWAKKELMEAMEPYEYGGGMILSVTKDKAEWAEIPDKFEAGTPNVAGAIGLGAAIDYLENIGMDKVRDHETNLNEYALDKLQNVDGLKILGPLKAKKRTGLISFVIDGMHPHDIASVINTEGVAVRSGHHCAMPLHKLYNIPASTRASFYIYNDQQDIDLLIKGIEKARKILT